MCKNNLLNLVPPQKKAPDFNFLTGLPAWSGEIAGPWWEGGCCWCWVDGWGEGEVAGLPEQVRRYGGGNFSPLAITAISLSQVVFTGGPAHHAKSHQHDATSWNNQVGSQSHISLSSVLRDNGFHKEHCDVKNKWYRSSVLFLCIEGSCWKNK